MKTNQLVEMRGQRPVTTSLQIAHVFGKEHAKVLAAIRNLDCSSEFIAANFGSYHYHSKLNDHVSRKLPMYYITRDGFTFLAMGFTGKVAAKFKEDYINAFNAMGQTLKTAVVPKSLYTQALKRIADLQAEAKHQVPQSLRPAKLHYLTEEYYAAIINSFTAWLSCENLNCYNPDIRDEKLVARFKAARLLYFDRSKSLPASELFSNHRIAL